MLGGSLVTILQTHIWCVMKLAGGFASGMEWLMLIRSSLWCLLCCFDFICEMYIYIHTRRVIYCTFRELSLFFISRNSTTMPSTVSRSPPINDPVLIVCMYIHIYIMHTWVWHETYGRYQIFCIVECNNGWDMVIERPAKKKIHQIRVIWFLNNGVNRITIFKFLNWK